MSLKTIRITGKPRKPDSQWVRDEDEIDINDDCFNATVTVVQGVNFNFPYEILASPEILEEMAGIVMKAGEFIESQPSTVIRILLQEQRWDRERLLDMFFDNERKLLKAAKLEACAGRALNNPSTKLTFCEICYSEEMITGFQCGHLFCSSCLTLYFKEKIQEQGVADWVPCPGDQCPFPLDDDLVLRYGDSVSREKYKTLLANSFVHFNRLMFWCPGVDCGKAVKLPYKEAKSVECECGFVCCAKCEKTDHSPLECNELKDWLSLIAQETASERWILSNTKSCPKCKSSIEKDGGCNWMTCRKCNATFCWICLTACNHGRCNVYTNQVGVSNAADKAAELLRLEHYALRYKTHLESLKLEERVYPKLEEAVHEFGLVDEYVLQLLYLRRITNTLVKCRRTLAHTFAFAHQLKKSPRTEIFEHNQAELEKETEMLSGLMGLTPDELLARPQSEIEHRSANCEIRRVALLNQVYEGYEDGSW